MESEVDVVGEHKTRTKKRHGEDDKNMEKKREEGKLKNIIVQSPQARYSINYRFLPSFSFGHRVCSVAFFLMEIQC